MTLRPIPLAIALVFAAAGLGPGVAVAAAPVGVVTVSGAWSRPVAPGLSTGVAYLTLHNDDAAPDRLLGATSPVAAKVELHQSMDMGAMMAMQPVTDGLALPPGVTVALAPRAYHLMLEGLKTGLQAGETYPLTLRFAHARAVTVDVKVRPNTP